MSSRALRKLQKEQELEKQLAAARLAQEEIEESEDDSTDSKPLNAFDMLDGTQEEGDDDDDDDHDVPVVLQTPSIPQSSTTKAKQKKKKQKKKKKPKDKDVPAIDDESGDEIDRALKEISAKDSGHIHEVPTVSWEAAATTLLAIDQKALNPVNEMRGLFGSIALEGETRTQPRSQRRRDANLQGGVDLATALTGRYSVASRGKELGSLASRRNIFMQGKEEWPLATSGGLSMGRDEDEGFEKRYNILHNPLYQETQMRFRAAVESMQPDNMIGLLSQNPYHIATLLQVSEIAKHQGDHSVSGDLLERALFSFGRSVHSSFPAALREGTARVSFDKPQNRELYLTIWRYMRNLEMRGTWRTAFEWSKVLLQLNTLSDPYGVTMMIDQLALRGRQHQQLLELASDEAYGNAWKHLPNIQISLSLAYVRSQKPRDARKQLALAMHQYPYVLSALASSLDISPLPKSLWAKLPSTDAEKLYTELYVTRTKDLWNTPETSSLLVEVAETLQHYESITKQALPPPRLEISLEEARHIMLLEIPTLIALLPRKFTNMPTSGSDVLPPPNSESDFTQRAPIGASGPSTLQNILSAGAAGTGGVFQRILNWFHSPAGPNDNVDENGETEGQAAYRQMREQLGGQDIPDGMLEEMLRMHLHEGDEEVTAQGLGMAGGWDDHDTDTESMPELEEVPEQPRDPRAATVEEADEDEEDTPRRGTSNGTVLRRVDSDDDEHPHPEPTHTLFAPTVQSSTPTTDLSAADESDPQRLQRWLLSAGLTELQQNHATLGRYVARLKMLNRQQQNWTVNMVRQRASKGLGDQVAALL